MDVPTVEEFLESVPIEIALLVMSQRRYDVAPGRSLRPYHPSTESAYLQDTFEERIYKAGTRSPTWEEASNWYMNGDGGWVFVYNPQNNSLSATGIPRSADEGTIRIVARIREAGAQYMFSYPPPNVDKGKDIIVSNVHNTSILVDDNSSRDGWISFFSGDVFGYKIAFACLELRSIYPLLFERFKIVAPDRADELAREWTLNAFMSVVNVLKKEAPVYQDDPLPNRNLENLLLYLVINASSIGFLEGSLADHLSTQERVRDQAYIDSMVKFCQQLEEKIVAFLKG